MAIVMQPQPTADRRRATAVGPTPLAVAGLGIMLAAITGAWSFELIGGYVPCALCLEQRVPYYVAIPLALSGAAGASRAPLPGRALLMAAAACMVWGAGLGVYHAGAEWGFWAGPTTCGATGTVRDAGGLLAQLETETFVSCNLASARLLGLSFAGWNVVAAGTAAALLFAATLLPVRLATAQLSDAPANDAKVARKTA